MLCVIRGVILRVNINKDDKEADYYRWQGAERTL